jgi:hypothetical protein
MDAIIKIPSSEFNEELFKKIGALVKNRNAVVTIAVHDEGLIPLKNESHEEFYDRLRKSINDIESGKGITFSMAELEDFIKH